MAATLYGFVERLLIPFGLHHIWNVPFFFEIGSFTDAAGKVIHGDINRFFAGDPTAGILGGAYLFKMWGLPAAAFAIWHSAKPEQKQKIGSIMVSAALTSFLTGITEPIEFAFLFVAPLLYGIHAVLAGASQLLFGLLGAKLGFTFSQGFIDYILYYSLDTKPWLVLLVGPIFALIYYGVFRLAIQKLDLKTPGRETEETLADIAIEGLGAGEARAVALIQCFGGRKNIKSLDACITRLRVDLNDISKLQVDRLKSLGATGVLTVGNGAQAIFGPLSENLKSDMEAALRQNLPGVDDESMASLHAPIASSATSNEASATKPTAEILKKVSQWMTALGGSENILSSELCGATRIRLVMKNASQLNENLLRDADVQAVMRLPNEVVHLIVGTTAPIYALAMKK
jgi:PTS system glucose-specific IIC component